jgi:hypothetical protein
MELVGVGQTCGPQKKMMVNNGETGCHTYHFDPFWGWYIYHPYKWQIWG